jgi:pimeloyl-ACP methyl ester carboxylesterase
MVVAEKSRILDWSEFLEAESEAGSGAPQTAAPRAALAGEDSAALFLAPDEPSEMEQGQRLSLLSTLRLDALISSFGSLGSATSPSAWLSLVIRGLTPASASATAWALLAHPPIMESGLFMGILAATSVETAFNVYRRAARAARKENPRAPAVVDNVALWRRALDATGDYRAFVEGWFDFDGNKVEKPSYADLSRRDVERWIAGNTFGKEVADLETVEVAQIQKMRVMLEKRLKHRFVEGEAKYPAMTHPLDPMVARQHPLLLYAAFGAIRSSYRAELRSSGLRRVRSGSISYWYRRGVGTPVVFVHGIGIGLAAYRKPLAELTLTNAPLFFVEIDAVSTTLSKEKMQPMPVVTADILKMLDEHESGSPGVFIGHSFGTSVLAGVVRDAPSRVAGMVFVEPVCFLLNLSKVTKRFLYAKDAGPILDIIRMDPGNAETIRRRFWWQESSVFLADLRKLRGKPVACFLADDDKIVPSEDVASYLGRARFRKIEVERYAGGHGEWQSDEYLSGRVVSTALQFKAASERTPILSPARVPKRMRFWRTPANGYWTVHENVDLFKMGDVQFITGPDASDVEKLKEICEKKGYSAFSIGSFEHAALKLFDAPVTVDDCMPSRGYTNSIYIFRPADDRVLSEQPAPHETGESGLLPEEEESVSMDTGVEEEDAPWNGETEPELISNRSTRFSMRQRDTLMP